MTRILIAFIILFLLSTCSFGATIKATGTARVTIVEPEEVVVNFDNYTVVFTEQGATAQVVF